MISFTEVYARTKQFCAHGWSICFAVAFTAFTSKVAIAMETEAHEPRESVGWVSLFSGELASWLDNENVIVHFCDERLALLHQPRLEARVPVSRHIDLNIAVIALQASKGPTVAAVA